jgi:monoamine oxidase
MISYVEGDDVYPYVNKNGKLKNENIIKNKIQSELKLLFPEKQIIEPSYFKVHFWKIGDHSWLTKTDSNKIMKHIVNPIDNIYICGEAYSHNQAWMEGALESATNVIDVINKK